LPQRAVNWRGRAGPTRRPGERASERGEERQRSPAVARKSYVHPAVLEAYLEGTIGGALLEAAEEQPEPPPVATSDEASEVVKLIRARIRAKDGSGRSQRTR